MGLGELGAALRAAWGVLVVSLLLGAGAAVAVTSLQTPEYTSVTRLFVSTTEVASVSEIYQGSQFSEQRVTSYAEVVTGRALAERVIERLELDMAAPALQAKIGADGVPGTVLLDVSVTDPSPQLAQRIAGAVSEEFTARVGELEGATATGASPVSVTTIEPPTLPGEPSAPRTKQNVAFGMFAGLLAGGAVVLARSRLHRTVTSSAEATELTDAPVLGFVSHDRVLRKRHVVDLDGARRAAEQYRLIRNALQRNPDEDPAGVILVSSAVAGEGRTTTAVNLALALAAAGRQVTLVDADLRTPSVAEYLRLSGEPGLTEVLAGTADMTDALQRHGDLAVLTAGAPVPRPGELVLSPGLQALIEKLRGENDVVVVDGPPVLPVADVSGLAGHVDAVLLVVRHGATRDEDLEQASVTLSRVGVTPRGVVLNRVPRKAGPPGSRRSPAGRRSSR